VFFLNCQRQWHRPLALPFPKERVRFQQWGWPDWGTVGPSPPRWLVKGGPGEARHILAMRGLRKQAEVTSSRSLYNCRYRSRASGAAWERARRHIGFDSGHRVLHLWRHMLWRLRAFPDFVEPCLPSPVERPPAGSDWIHEIKHDGFRLLARRGASGVRLFTRSGHNLLLTSVTARALNYRSHSHGSSYRGLGVWVTTLRRCD
jgi:hypothetical protein